MSTTQTGAAPGKSSIRRIVIVLLLALAGGGVDAILISRFQVLTGAQTGNTVLLAVALAQGRFAAGFYSAVSVAGFIIGSVAGELVILKRKPESALGPIRWALLAELVPLGALVAVWHAAPNPGWKMTAVMVALAAGPMGIQSAAVLHLHESPTTTYVTGTLSKFSSDLARWLFVRKAEARCAQSQDQKSASAFVSGNGGLLYGLDWLVYLGGGISSALLFSLIKEIALLLPISAIVAVILVTRTGRSDLSG